MAFDDQMMNWFLLMPMTVGYGVDCENHVGGAEDDYHEGEWRGHTYAVFER